ncbi:MAG: NADH-ubiquinone oxidoreductase-F iron-sulfur binding region domain-containing protein [Bacteroidales bacterium]|nr:NADH-ubiquinone oxidoreductase-F iron-sulfur binding region domain-containing protein [Bacteroidales bacterium]
MSAIQLQIGYNITSLELQYKWEGQFLSLFSKNEHFILKDKETDIQANDNDIIIERFPNTGVKGFLYAEPIVWIKHPLKRTLYFKNLEPNQLPWIIECIVNLDISSLTPWLQLDDTGESWPHVPFISQMPWYNKLVPFLTDSFATIDLQQDHTVINNSNIEFITSIFNKKSSAEVKNLIFNSNLIGRGSGTLPIEVKWRAIDEQLANKKYLIVNANEFGPSSLSNYFLLRYYPSLILEGVISTCYALHITNAIIAIHQEYLDIYEAFEKLISYAKSLGLLGDDIMNSGNSLSIDVMLTPGMLITGEETALIHLLESQMPFPTNKPPYPTSKGIWGYPTLVHNVETIANIAKIIRNNISLESLAPISKQGTKIVTLCGEIDRYGIYEISMDTSIEDVIFKIGGGLKNQIAIKGFHIGGITGRFFGLDNLEKSLYDIEKETNYLGTSTIFAFSNNQCVVQLLQHIAEILTEQSCGKCIPCLYGSRVWSELVNYLSQANNPLIPHFALYRLKTILSFNKLDKTVTESSLCALGKSLSQPFISAYTAFREEIEEHIFDKYCRSFKCVGLRSYVINEDLCTGCGLCLVECPVNAIIEKRINLFVILDGKCVGCGLCENICKFSAINLKK